MNSSEKYWISTNEAISVQTKTILNDYFLNLKLADKAEATISRNRSILEQFFCECTIPIEDLILDDVLKWFQAYSVGKKERKLDLVLSELSSFFKFCTGEDYVDNMVVESLWRSKIPQPLQKYLNEQEYARVYLAMEQLPLRDRVLVLFLFSSGCRRGELAQFDIQDVDLAKRSAVVKGRSKKIRNIHFSEECGLLLTDYLSTRSGDQTEPLFVNKLNNGLGQNEISYIITKLERVAGLKKTLHPHIVYRHTFAINMFPRGRSLDFIAGSMRLTDLKTTLEYVRIPREDMILSNQ